MKYKMHNAKRITQIAKIILFLVAFFYVTRYTLHAPRVLADSGQYGQYGQYGGTPSTQSIVIDKLVAKPGGTQTKGGVVSYEYVDNLSPADVRYSPGGQVLFRLKVKNTSNTTLSNVTVKDFVPNYIDPVEGPGTFDATNRTITFDAGSFAADEEKTYQLKMQLYPQDKMPADKGLFCMVNRAQAYNGNVSDEDTAQICVEKQVIGAKATPKAGPEMGLVLLAGQIGMIGAGLKLTMTRRK